MDTNDFLRAVEEATGRNLEGFFEQWLYRPGVPSVQASYDWNDNFHLAEITLTQTQKIDESHPAFRMTLTVGFYDKDGSATLRTMELKEASQQFLFPLNTRPAFVQIDPHNDVLMDLTFNKTAPILLTELKAGPAVTGRLRAVEQLAEMDEPRIVQALGQSLEKDAFWGVRAAAARALGKNGGDEARAVLLRAAERKGLDPRVRRAVLEGLGGAAGQEARTVLVEALWDEGATARVRSAAAAALSKMEKDKAEAEKELRRALQIDSLRQQVRVAAIEGLERLGATGSLQDIRLQAEPGRPMDSRAAALQALGALAKKDGSKAALTETRGLLLAALDDDALAIRRAAVQGLGSLGDEEAIPALEAIAAKASEGRLKPAAEKAIEQIRQAKGNQAELARLRKEAGQARSEREKIEKRLKAIESKLDSLAKGAPGKAKTDESPASKPAMKKGESHRERRGSPVILRGGGRRPFFF